MNDLLKLKDAQIEALQKENEKLRYRLSEASAILSEIAKEFEVINPEILNNGRD